MADVANRLMADLARVPNTKAGKAEAAPKNGAVDAEGPAAVVEVRTGTNVFTLVTRHADRDAVGVHLTTKSRRCMPLGLLKMWKMTRSTLIPLLCRAP